MGSAMAMLSSEDFMELSEPAMPPSSMLPDSSIPPMVPQPARSSSAAAGARTTNHFRISHLLGELFGI